MKIKSILLLYILFYSFSLSASPEEEKIVFIHGFLGAPWNMYFLNKNFKKHGWDTYCFEYYSREKTIEEHAKDLVNEINILRKNDPDKKICFIAHSLGSLVLRKAYNDPLFPKELKDTKIILIAPPNKGSIFGRELNKYSIIRNFAKDKSGKELMTLENFDHLGEFEDFANILVIAGSLGINPYLPFPNDGTVAVKETFLNTNHKHIVVRRGHKNIIFSKKTFSIALDFFKE